MEADLISLMLASAPVAALVSDRIWPVSRPQNSALPGVTVTRVSGAPSYADDGETGLLDARIQVDCWGASYASVAAVADALESLLSATVDTTQGATVFIYIMIDDRRDLRETGTGQAEYLFRTLIDLQIVYRKV